MPKKDIIYNYYFNANKGYLNINIVCSSKWKNTKIYNSIYIWYLLKYLTICFSAGDWSQILTHARNWAIPQPCQDT